MKNDSKALIIVLGILLLAVILFLIVGDTPHTTYAATIITESDKTLERITDKEAGVMCYLYNPQGNVWAMECVYVPHIKR